VKLLGLEGITTIDQANAFLDQTFLSQHNARFAIEPADDQDAHRPGPTVEALDAALCPVRQARSVDKTGCVSWQGRCFEFVGRDATPRRRRKVQVRQRLDGEIELLDTTGQKALESRELPDHPSPPPRKKPTASERVAEHAPPYTPPADHPWRRSVA
jgi:hypothetical protein